MADYPNLTPTLAALNAALSIPADSESANKWPVVDRQTRNWLYSFLTLYFDSSTNKLKPFAYGDGTVPTGSVRGTNPASGAQREIVQGSIQTVDVADGFLTATKCQPNFIVNTLIADNTISGLKINVNSLPADRLIDLSMPGGKLQLATVNGSALIDATVPLAKLADNCIATRCVVNRSISPAKLPQVGEGELLVGGNTDTDGTPNCAVPKAISGAITIDKDGVTSLNASVVAASLNFVRIVEKAGNGVGGGTSNLAPVPPYTTGPYGFVSLTTQPWQNRGMGAPWSVVKDPGSVIQSISLYQSSINISTPGINSGAAVTYTHYEKRIYVQIAGTYFVMLTIPGYNCGNHRARMTVVPDPLSANNDVLYGTTAQAAAAVQTDTTLTALITFGAAVGNSYPYFYVEWAADVAIANGMGLFSSKGTDEYYGQITMLKLA